MGDGKTAAKLLIEKTDDNTFLVCRSIGHIFDETTSEVERIRRKFRWTMECARCGTARTKTLDQQGRIIGSSYKYPEKYKIPGTGRLDAAGHGILRIFVLVEILPGS